MYVHEAVTRLEMEVVPVRIQMIGTLEKGFAYSGKRLTIRPIVEW
jgi:hypothetical protein